MFGREQSGINRKKAILEGKNTYTSVSPCKHCGSFEKYVSSYGCVICNIKRNVEKLKDNELMAKYRTKAKQNSKTYRYRTRKINQMPSDADQKLILEFYLKAEKLTLDTCIEHHVDHIIPISKGGLHHQDNLQVLTRIENLKKGNKIL
jgi:5-methylcytosine-specific restriction endonuclease McrA